jgi:hypothetical protein
MIGTSIRSVRHLFRVSDASFKTILVKFKENAWDICKVVKLPNDSPFGETMFVFNNYIRQSHWSFDTIASSKEFRDFIRNEGYGRVITTTKGECANHDGFFQEITLLPDSFDKDYEKFLKENNKMISNLSAKYGLNTRDIRVKRMYIYTEGSKNFFQWAATVYYQNGTSLATIKNILNWNESYKQLAKNLSKGTITAYTSRDAIALLLKEMTELRKDKRINDSINSFNTAQKKMLKENKLGEDVKQALWRLSRLSDTKRLNFIKKMSDVNDFAELTRQLKFVTSVHFSWSKEAFMDFIDNVEEIKCEKIYENDNVVLIKAIDYETIKQLGKTTNWCISKNKQYWNNYIENFKGMATQYMVFDFSRVEDDKLSIIGFTVTRNKGITSAHNFINEPLMNENDHEQVFLESFISRFKDNKNIYSILADDGIDITLVVHYDALPYAWDKNSMMDYLYECVNPENVTVLTEKNGKVALSVVDENIRYFLGDAYHDNIPSDYYNYQHIIFADFNKNKYDTSKLQFAIIEEGYGDEDYCNGVYNECALNNGQNFDSKLIEFELPYNTIRRTNNIEVRLRNAIGSYNTPMIKDCMKSCDRDTLKHVIKCEYGSDGLYDLIMNTLRQHVSFDYLNLLYDNGLHINDFMDSGYMGDIIKQLAYDMTSISRATERFTKLEAVSDDDIEALFNRKIDRREDAKYVGLFTAIKKIIQNENLEDDDYNLFYRNFAYYIAHNGKKSAMYEQILMMGIKKIKFKKDDCSAYVLKYAAYYGSDELKAFVEDAIKDNGWLKQIYSDYKAEYEKYSKPKKESSMFTISNSEAMAFTYVGHPVEITVDANHPF